MSKHAGRRAVLAAFMDALDTIVADNPAVTGLFAVLLTENGRSIAFTTPDLGKDPVTVCAEITRCRNAFAAPHGVTTADLTQRMIAIAQMEDGEFRGRA